MPPAISRHTKRNFRAPLAFIFLRLSAGAGTNGKYAKVLSLTRRYKLVAKEKQRIDRADYLPIIQLYSFLSEYLENIITKEKLINSVVKASQDLMSDKYRSRKIIELLDELGQSLPEEIKIVKKELGVVK